MTAAASASLPDVDHGPVWTGGFAEREVGIRLRNDPERSLVPVELLVGVALRRNPKRAQLLVSTVLAKHVPTDPGLVIVAAQLLGLLVAGELDGRRPSPALFARLARILQLPSAARSAAPRAAPAAPAAPADASSGDAAPPATARAELAALRADVDARRSEHPRVVTIGYAETATGLGQVVAETIGSYYIHSTRLAPAGARAFAGFEEEHSHATSHQLYPADPAWLQPGGTVVLVDDELSTGTTIVNTIRALHATAPQARWVVASLIDLRSADDRRRFDDLAAALATSIAVVSLGAGSIALPPDVAARAARALRAPALPALALPAPAAGGRELLESRTKTAPGAFPQPGSPAPGREHPAEGRELLESRTKAAPGALPQPGSPAPGREHPAEGREPLESRTKTAPGALPQPQSSSPGRGLLAGGRELPESAAAAALRVLPQDRGVPEGGAAGAAGKGHAAKGRESSYDARGGTMGDPSRSAAAPFADARAGATASLVLGVVTVLEAGVDAPPNARFGIDARPGAGAGRAARVAATAVAGAVAAVLTEHGSVLAAGGSALPEGESVLVLGSEEFIALPLAVADHLARGTAEVALCEGVGGGGGGVRFSTTTRSPISAVDREDYAIASAVTFQSHDVTNDGFGVRFAYNLTRGGRRFDAIVFVPEPEADRDRMLAPDGVVEALRRVTDHVIVAHLAATPPTATPSAAAAAATPGTPTPTERQLP